ncbi:hypothetical protein D3C80_1486740 [compost metagenome]
MVGNTGESIASSTPCPDWAKADRCSSDSVWVLQYACWSCVRVKERSKESRATWSCNVLMTSVHPLPARGWASIAVLCIRSSTLSMVNTAS